jgi:hypothetical protein
VHNEGLHSLFSSIRVIVSRRARRAGDETLATKRRNAYDSSVRNRKGKNNSRGLGLDGRMVGSVRVCLRGVECEGMQWIQLIQYTVE